MENEIDLRKIAQIIWRGKYLILGVTALLTLAAALYVFQLAVPSYRYSALLDLTTHGIEGKQVQALIDQNRVVGEAVKDLADEPGELAQAARVKLINDKEPVFQIEVKYTDPETCIEAVKQIGAGIIEAVSGHRLQQVSLEREHMERLIVYLEEAIEKHLASPDSRISELLEEDPVYRRLLVEKAENLIAIENLSLIQEELSTYSSADAEAWADSQNGVARPVAVNKRLYLAVAFLFGLMLSLLILFVCHYLSISGPGPRDRVSSGSNRNLVPKPEGEKGS